MKILLLSGYPLTDKVSGSLVHTAKLAEYISAINGMEVHAITMGDQRASLKRGNVTVHTVSRSLLLNPCLYPFAVKAVNRIARAINPDIVHAMRGFPYPSLALSLKKKYPTLLTLFSLPQKELRYDKSWISILARVFVDIPTIKYVLPRMPHIIVQTGFIESLIKDSTAAKIHIIPEGIEYDRIRQLSTQKPAVEKPDTFIAVSFRKLKGLDILIKAVPAVLKSVPNLNVCIGGAGEEDASLKSLAKELGVENHVTFPGFITDEAVRYGYYNACKIVVVPSRWDNEPFAPMDGAVLGKPAIVSDAANASVVVDGKTGYVIKSEDVAALSGCMIKLLTDDNLREEMGKAIQQKVKEYDWPRIAGKTVDVYRNVIADYKQKKDMA